MTTTQRRLLFFVGCTLLFGLLCLLLHPGGAIFFLGLLLIFLSSTIGSIYRLVVHPPHQPSAPEEEYSSYEEGYPVQEVPYYQPSMPKEAPVTEDVPAAQYPEMQQYR